MRILMRSDHVYPAEDHQASGRRPKERPTVAPRHVHDLIARGLAELGHEVFYHLDGVAEPLPPGIVAVTEPMSDVNVWHNAPSTTHPWVHTQHRTIYSDAVPLENLVFVSRTLAELYGSTQFVRNGIDPKSFIYSESKGDYLLFMGAMQGWAHVHKHHDKGLDIALVAAQTAGRRLVVAGTTRDQEMFELVDRMCADHGAEFVGDVRGKEKAELLAGARALLFPTRLDEGCPLVVAESLMSGTPVISSPKCPCPELLPAEVGFLCDDIPAYVAAIDQAHTLSPQACRDHAMAELHYHRMAEGYVEQYRLAIERHAVTTGS